MLTDRELQEHDEAAARRVRDAEFLKAHPEYAAPQAWRDLGSFIAADENIDPALRAFFGAKPSTATKDLLNRAAAKQKPRAFSGEPISQLGGLV